MTSVIVCGGRDFTDEKHIYGFMDQMHQQLTITTVIEGDCKGVDRIAGRWAAERGVSNVKFPADWAQHGHRAVYVRNKAMIEQTDATILMVFPGGRGTNRMRDLATKARLTVYIFDAPAEKTYTLPLITGDQRNMLIQGISEKKVHYCNLLKGSKGLTRQSRDTIDKNYIDYSALLFVLTNSQPNGEK